MDREISIEAAEQSVATLCDAFEIIDPRKRDLPTLVEAVAKGRLQIEGEGEDVVITQHLRRAIDGNRSLAWNWSRLGIGKARVKMGTDGIAAFGQTYQTAAPMVGLEVAKIQTMHPNDLSLLEDVVGFFNLL